MLENTAAAAPLLKILVKAAAPLSSLPEGINMKKTGRLKTQEGQLETIEIFGAREHNLKNIDIVIPKNQLVVITGISGSGKSSLAFDTIYAEGQRRYMETFGAYARQFIGEMERPDVDKITGLSPVISIEQKTTNKNPRSTVGTVTEVYDFLRLLFARASEAWSYNTGKKMVRWSEDQIVNNIYKRFDGNKITILAPLIRGRKGHYRELFEEVRKKGFLKVRVDGEVKDLVPKMQVDRYKIHDIELVIDRMKVTKDMRTRISQSVQHALKAGKDLMFLTYEADAASGVAKYGEVAYSRLLMCEATGISYEEPSPNSFSFNSPYGACPACKGLGQVYTVDMEAIIPDDSKTINEGGIAPLGGEREAYVFRQVQLLIHFSSDHGSGYTTNSSTNNGAHSSIACSFSNYSSNSSTTGSAYNSAFLRSAHRFTTCGHNSK